VPNPGVRTQLNFFIYRVLLRFHDHDRDNYLGFLENVLPEIAKFANEADVETRDSALAALGSAQRLVGDGLFSLAGVVLQDGNKSKKIAEYCKKAIDESESIAKRVVMEPLPIPKSAQPMQKAISKNAQPTTKTGPTRFPPVQKTVPRSVQPMTKAAPARVPPVQKSFQKAAPTTRPATYQATIPGRKPASATTNLTSNAKEPNQTTYQAIIPGRKPASATNNAKEPNQTTKPTGRAASALPAAPGSSIPRKQWQ